MLGASCPVVASFPSGGISGQGARLAGTATGQGGTAQNSGMGLRMSLGQGSTLSFGGGEMKECTHTLLFLYLWNASFLSKLLESKSMLKMFVFCICTMPSQSGSYLV